VTEGVQEEDLIDLIVEHLRRHAEESAASLENDEQKTALKNIESLRRDVDDLLKIFSKDKKLRMWVDSVISPPDRDGKIRLLDGAKRHLQVSDFWGSNSGGTTYLAGALWAAFTIGGLVPEDPHLKAEKARIEQRLRKAFTAPALAKRWPGSDEKIAKLAEMCEQMTVGQIAQELGISKGAAKQRIQRANLQAKPNKSCKQQK
jgi:hypothetical protein